MWMRMKYKALWQVIFSIVCHTSYNTLFTSETHTNTHTWASWGILSRHQTRQICRIRALICVFRYDLSIPSENYYNNLKSSKLPLAIVQLQADRAEMLPNKSGDSCPCKIAGVSWRRHVSDRLEPIKSFEGANSSRRERTQMEVPLTKHCHCHTYRATSSNRQAHNCKLKL